MFPLLTCFSASSCVFLSRQSATTCRASQVQVVTYIIPMISNATLSFQSCVAIQLNSWLWFYAINFYTCTSIFEKYEEWTLTFYIIYRQSFIPKICYRWTHRRWWWHFTREPSEGGQQWFWEWKWTSGPKWSVSQSHSAWNH